MGVVHFTKTLRGLKRKANCVGKEHRGRFLFHSPPTGPPCTPVFSLVYGSFLVSLKLNYVWRVTDVAIVDWSDGLELWSAAPPQACLKYTSIEGTLPRISVCGSIPFPKFLQREN